MATIGRYKAHECPTCKVTHKGKGPFCSKVCSNRGRDDEYKQRMRERALYTDTGQLTTWTLNWDETKEPVLAGGSGSTLPANQFVEGGDIWETFE